MTHTEIATRRDHQRRVWAKIQASDFASCWPWSGRISPEGYGYIRWMGRTSTAHRATWCSIYGEISSPGLEVDHVCRNRSCCNPLHLELVTKRENIARGESPQAANARKTHCPNGHPLDGENLVVGNRRGKPFRQCRTCNNESHRRMWAKQRLTKTGRFSPQGDRCTLHEPIAPPSQTEAKP